jgi:hypothetical protein
MEEFQELREIAHKKISLADHMLTMTYPLVRDTKLLLVVLENIFLAMTNAMSSVLYYERLFKRVPPFKDSFEDKLTVFREKCAERYKIDPLYLKMIKDIKTIIVQHRKSPVEFVRKDRFVICSDSYKVRTVALDQIKNYISRAKNFVNQTSFIVSQNERIFR